MVIQDNRHSAQITFGDLEAGDAFAIGDSIYVKTETDMDTLSNAMCLRTCGLLIFKNAQPVQSIHATVILSDKSALGVQEA